ncbi:Ribosomal protein L11 methyltransferase [Gammaproteobacteria bacterium]
MSWLQLCIEIDPDHTPLIESWLEEEGALAVSLTDGADEAIYEPPPATLPLWSRTQVTGLFADTTDVVMVAARLTEKAGQQLNWRVQSVADRDWERVWLDDFHPLSCGSRLWICPFGSSVPHPEAVVLWLDPGLAFGTGHHPTTALCLEWLDASLKVGCSVVDYGCGSGILGLAALRLGATQCWAVDHDPQAIRATLANAARNGIATCQAAEMNSHSLVAELMPPLWAGLPEHLPAIKADLLLANILARPLVELAVYFSGMIQPGGYIVLSGILDHQETEIISAYQSWFDFQPAVVRMGWICLVGIRNRSTLNKPCSSEELVSC